MAHIHLAVDFLYAAFALLSLLLSEPVSAEETRYVSTVSRGYLNAESGSPYFECYRSAPDLDAVVESGRYVHTYNTALPPPVLVEVTDVGTTTSTIYRAEFTTSNYNSYGVFYCASRYDGGWTVVPTIFLRSDADFLPLGERFTKTVNMGDTAVRIDFQNTITRNENSNWRHNGTLDSGDTFINEPNRLSYTIPDVQPSDGGVYELHYGRNRGTGRAGLMRLIVRDCPAGRHTSSSACLLPCPSCYNGGICDDKTGRCICPPGFMGDNCETGCGGNRYGRNCEYRCNYDTGDNTTCSGLQVCVPDPYGCSCTPGYTDLNCTTVCSRGKFGASCTESCNCVSGECDRFTGVCTGNSTECLPGWRGVNCQECAIGKYGPDCSGNIVTTYIKTNEGIPSMVTCTLEGGQLASKADPIVTLYMKSGSQDYNLNITADSTGHEYSYSVTISPSKETFYCSMIDVNTYFSSNIRGEGSFVLPILSRDPRVGDVTNVSMTLTWDAWDELTDMGDPPIVGYDVYFREDGSNSSIQEVTSRMLDTQLSIPNLKPDTYYMFGVRAVRPGEGGEGPWRNVSERTHCPPPEGPGFLNATNSTMQGQIIVFVEVPEEGANCGDGFTGVRIFASKLDDSSVMNRRAVSGYFDFDIQASNMYVLKDLESSSAYSIYVVLLNRGSESPASEEFIGYTSETAVPPPTRSSNVIPGVVGGIVVVLIITVAVILIVLRLRRRRESESDSMKMAFNGEASERKEKHFEPTQDNGTTPESTPEASLQNEPPGRSDIYENVGLPGTIHVGELEAYVKSMKAKEDSGFDHDYKLLPDFDGTSPTFTSKPQTVAAKQENKKKNRFKNILTYDHSRIVLPVLDEKRPHSDYYNASYIKDHTGADTFIASQAPNTASINDFWRLIWQENVCSIVMLTNLIEKGRDRCTEYWPKRSGEELTFGGIELRVSSTTEYCDHVHRVIDAKETGGKETRAVHQFHYRVWPDMGVPAYATNLISFVEEVKQAHNKMTSRSRDKHMYMLVHCSAGVGRTGTFISIYTLLDQMEQGKKLNIFGFISKMRENRPKMVQTLIQYEFIHTALLEAYLSRDTAVPVSEFHNKLVSLEEGNADLDRRNIDREFKILEHLTPRPDPQNFSNAIEPDNIDKNRYRNILPTNGNRPCLVTQGEPGSTGYINASFLHTYQNKDVFLATQMPLPHTTGDIWRLAFDWKCPIIVMLNDLDQNDHSCAQYWPESDSVRFGALDVAVTSTSDRKHFIVRDFQIQNSNEQWSVKQFQLLHCNIQQAIRPLGDLLEAVTTAMKRVETPGPVIVHCMNGMGRTGVFTTVYSAAEKVITDGLVDIFQTVKRMRALRPGMVDTVEHYHLCYKLLAEHMKKYDEYSNLDM